MSWKDEVRNKFFWINPNDYGDTVDPAPCFVGGPDNLIDYIETLLKENPMDDVSKLKIDIFDAQREQERLHFRIKELEKTKQQKISQLKELEERPTTKG